MTTTDTLATLRTVAKRYLPAFLEQRRILEQIESANVSNSVFGVVQQLSGMAQAAFGILNILPFLDFGSLQTGVATFDRHGLLAYVSGVIGILRGILDQEEIATGPVTEHLDFSFLSDSRLQQIVARDFAEAQRAYVTECWKAVIVLSGGIIETLLLDALLREETKAVAAKSAPKGGDLRKWDLSDLIKVAVELEVVERSVEGLAETVRQYRNLVHAGNELRSGLKPDRLEAENGLTILKIVRRDLANRY